MSVLENCKLLFVDDEEDFLTTMVKLLRRKKMNVAGTSSARTALEWFATHDVDIVVLDIRMPDMSGVEVLSRMRALKGSDFGVIILSGHAHTGLALNAMRAGANDFLLKPCDMDVLLERIDLVWDRIQEQRGS